LRCIVLSDCCGSYFPEFHHVAVRMICAQGGIFGWVADCSHLKHALARAASAVPHQVCQESPS
jgi:nicotinamidase-related amidase